MPVQVPESLDEAESEPTVLCGEIRVIQVQSSSFVSIFAKRKHPPGPALYVPIARGGYSRGWPACRPCRSMVPISPRI